MVNGEWSMVNGQSLDVRKKIKHHFQLSYFASGRRASYLADNLFERCRSLVNRQQKGLPQITQIYADWSSAFISAICGQQEAGTGSNRSKFPHQNEIPGTDGILV
jgi:hypothetical protein